MTRHSKNCTAGAFFTSAEREKLAQYGTQRERLGRDSLRTPIACVLCLREPACDAVACPEGGHVFCRECLLTHLLVCKRERVRALAEEERLQVVQERIALEEEETRQQKLVEAFTAANRPGGAKRARAVAEHEQTGKGGRSVPTTREEASMFWLPEKTPTVVPLISRPGGAKSASIVYCPATAEKDHVINMKQMLPIKWTRSAKDEEAAICSVCTNKLRVATAGLTLVRPCGHVFCGKCIGNIVDRADKLKDCPECSQPAVGTLRLAGEGSGFAGGGTTPNRLEVKKYDPAFI